VHKPETSGASLNDNPELAVSVRPPHLRGTRHGYQLKGWASFRLRTLKAVRS